MHYWKDKLKQGVNYFEDRMGNVLKIYFQRGLIEKGYFASVMNF